jgi:hypothetical protein
MPTPKAEKALTEVDNGRDAPQSGSVRLIQSCKSIQRTKQSFADFVFFCQFLWDGRKLGET